MNTYKEEDMGFMRLSDVLQVFPVSKSTWWAGVKIRRYPQPIKIGPRMTAWRKTDIRKLLENPEQRVFL
jgi:predicted DNA-binding transcriptional regulator AlpA